MTRKNEKLFKAYLEDEELRGHRDQGFSDLRSRVPWVLNYLESRDLRVNQMRIKEAQEYQGWLLEKKKADGGKYSKHTVNSMIIAAANFYEYVKRQGLISINPFKEIKRVRVDKKLPRNLLKEEETDQLLDELHNFDVGRHLKAKKAMYRTHLVAELIYSSGLRISEVADLKVSDIDFGKSIIKVREGKGGRTRVAWLSSYTRDILKLYVKRLRPLVFTDWHKSKKDSLFGVTHYVLGHSVNDVLNSVGASLGHEKCTTHMFRHQAGFHLLRAGCNIRHIQQILGHKNLKNTEIYTRVDKEDLKDVLDTFHPRKRKEGDR